MNEDEKWYEELKKAYIESGPIDEYYAELFMNVSHETDKLFIQNNENEEENKG